MSSPSKVIPRSALQRPCVEESHLCVSANIKKQRRSLDLTAFGGMTLYIRLDHDNIDLSRLSACSSEDARDTKTPIKSIAKFKKTSYNKV